MKACQSCPVMSNAVQHFAGPRSSFLTYFLATSVTCRIPWRPNRHFRALFLLLFFLNPFLGRTPLGSQGITKRSSFVEKNLFASVDQWNHIIRLFLDVVELEIVKEWAVNEPILNRRNSADEQTRNS